MVDSSGFSTGAKTERLPTPDKGQEVVAARFVRPSTAIQEFREQKIALVPPQFYLLTTLAEILQGSSNTAGSVHTVLYGYDSRPFNVAVRTVQHAFSSAAITYTLYSTCRPGRRP